jgi:hypothetical protein
MRIIKVVFLCLFLGSFFNSFAQDALVLKYENRVKRFRYHQGSKIYLKLTNEKEVGGVIHQFTNDSLLIVGDTIINHHDIERVFVRGGVKGNGALLGIAKAAAIVFPTILTINGLINKDSPVIPKSAYYIGGGSTAFYFARKYLFKRTFRVKEGKSSVSIVRFLPTK